MVAPNRSRVVFRFVNLLLSQMSVEELREEACDCLFEIINKGMDPVDKTKLVESLCQVLQSAGFFNVDQVQDSESELLAKYLNGSKLLQQTEPLITLYYI